MRIPFQDIRGSKKPISDNEDGAIPLMMDFLASEDGQAGESLDVATVPGHHSAMTFPGSIQANTISDAMLQKRFSDIDDSSIEQVKAQKPKHGTKVNQTPYQCEDELKANPANAGSNNGQQEAPISSEQTDSQLAKVQNEKQTSPFLTSVLTGGAVLAVYLVGKGIFNWLKSQLQDKKRKNSTRRFDRVQTGYDVEARW